MRDPSAVTEEKLLRCRSVLELILEKDAMSNRPEWVEICKRLNENVPAWRKEWRARLKLIEHIHKKRTKDDLVALNSIHNSLLVMYDDIKGAMHDLSA